MSDNATRQHYQVATGQKTVAKAKGGPVKKAPPPFKKGKK